MELRTDRNKSPFLVFSLRNNQGLFRGYLWNEPLKVGPTLLEKQTVKVEGVLKKLNGSMVIKINRIAMAEGNIQMPDVYQAPLHMDVNYWQERLSELISQIRDYNCKRLIRSFINDKAFFRSFISSPAGIKIHHNYKGGLLEHTVDLMSICSLFAESYQGLLNKDLLVTGAFCHDIGKTREMQIDEDEYTTEGKLLGHVLIGLAMMDAKISALEDFPSELAMALKHMIISHYGRYDFGSQVPPATPEALALHLLDNADAKLNHLKCHVEKNDPMAEWSTYDKILGTRIYQKNIIENRLTRDEAKLPAF